MSARLSPTPDERAHDPLIGARIAGRYRIDRVHARGGMSIVYAATYESQQREVAIKVLDESSAHDPEAVARFDHEARTASSLSHGHVVGVSDFGRLPDGRPYLVMPLIVGQDLATVIAEQGPMPAARVAALLSGVASALDTMHAQGLVHRDIKSENIMYVRADNGAESALVLDFGIAVAPSGMSAEDAGDASGTPDFMAPEQLAGQVSDHRADVYSLATVAFELLTGRLPYAGNDLADLLKRRAREKPRTLAKTTGMPFHPALEKVFTRGLARKPGDRPSSAGELIRELGAAAAKARAPLQAPSKPKVPARRAATLKALALQALGVATREGGAPRFGRLRTLVGLPFTRPPSAHANETVSAQLPPPAPASTPQSGVHRKPVPPKPKPKPKPIKHAAVAISSIPAPPKPMPAPEPSIVVDPSLLIAARRPEPRPQAQPIDSLTPIAEIEIDEPDFEPRHKASTRFAVIAAAAVVALAAGLWSRSSEPAAVVSTPISEPAIRPPAPPQPAPAPTPAPALAPLEPVRAPEPAPELAAAEPAAAEPVARKRAATRREPPPPARAPAPPRASAQELTQQGVDAMLRGDFATALDKLDAATRASPRYAPAFRSKGLVLERMGRAKDAAKAFQQYLKLEPEARDADKIRARLEAL